MENDPLAQLRDIHLPEPILWWPLAPGWWVLIILCLGTFTWLAIKAVQRYQANLYRRQAQQKLSLLNDNTAFRSEKKLVMVFEILKQAVNSAYPRHHYSSLEFSAFVVFLQSSCDKTLFELLPKDIDALLYGKAAKTDNNDLIMDDVFISGQNWVKHHYDQDKYEVQSQC
ncbi:MAG: DUF4381 domain-containing protein [Porticoccaceae bacterium]|nr:DUF4381 domain-containing protein [Porticoccaceae bacterium]|tara:strand:- start:5028 stop:5537 length:510 start_codon:yes stop_codon:yes gene_type:complete